MDGQKQKNTAAVVTVIVLILVVVLGIGLYFLFSKPAPAPVTPVKVETPVPAPTPAPVTETPAPSGPKLLGVHTVVPKDTLWWISDKWYKDPVLWPSIYEINKSEIRDPDRIFPGQKFDIPALSGTTANLSEDDKSLLAQGYLEAYRVYKEKGKQDAEDYKRVGYKLSGKPYVAPKTPVRPAQKMTAATPPPAPAASLATPASTPAPAPAPTPEPAAPVADPTPATPAPEAAPADTPAPADTGDATPAAPPAGQ